MNEYEYTDPYVGDALFEIRSTWGDTAYADTVAQAYCAYWQLHRDATLQTKVTIINLKTGKVAWSD